MKKFFPTIGITAIIFIFVNISSTHAFSDIEENHIYAIATEYLAQKEIINGYEDGTFRPFDKINRAELLKIILESKNIVINTPTTNCFPDVPYKEWFSPFICTAKALGYIDGYPDGLFRPAREINKVEALKILGEIYNWDLSNAVETQAFRDISKNAWYTPYISYAKMRNLLIESGNLYQPSANIGRGNISEILYRLLAINEFNTESFSNELESRIKNNLTSNEYTPRVSRGVRTPTITSRITQLEPGEIRIVLIWEQPEDPDIKTTDLDSHLSLPNDEEIFLTHKISSNLGIILETEDSKEIFTITNLEEGKYHYFVDKYSGEESLSASNTQVGVYDKNGLAKIFTIPSGEGKLWKVFELNENYEMTEINEVGNCELTGKITVNCPEN